MVRCILLLLLAGFAACNAEKTSILNPEALPTQSFRINTAFDTVIKTAGGVLLEIPAGSLAGGASADLQVKEAFAFTDMLKAGLTTQTADGILRSGGMLSINTTDKNISIAKPITVSVPTKDFDPTMQVFEGEQKNGKIEWKNPKPLQDTLPIYLARGKALFEGNCATCHAMDKVLTGPALHGVEYRGPWNDRKALFEFVRNPGEWSARSPYMKCMISQYGQTMTAFPQLSDDQLAAVFDYIRYDEIKNGLAFYRDPCQDSCSRYDSAMRAISALQSTRDTLTRLDVIVSEPDQHSDELENPSRSLETIEEAEAASIYVIKNTSSAAFYKFTINAPGWYNVDALIKDQPPLKESKLTVTLEGEKQSNVQIYLAVPSMKTMADAGRTNNANEYAFYTKDGKLYLPQGAEAYIFAMSETPDGILFGYKPFIITTSQNIPVSVHPSTKEEMYTLFSSLNFDSLNIKVEKAKVPEEHQYDLQSKTVIGPVRATAAQPEIRQLDKLIEEKLNSAKLFKPVGCDCGCPQGQPTAADSVSAAR